MKIPRSRWSRLPCVATGFLQPPQPASAKRLPLYQIKTLLSIPILFFLILLFWRFGLDYSLGYCILHLSKGENEMCDARAYERAIMALHIPHVKTKKEKLADRVSALYTQWSEENPSHSKEAGQLKYREIHQQVFGGN